MTTKGYSVTSTKSAHFRCIRKIANNNY